MVHRMLGRDDFVQTAPPHHPAGEDARRAGLNGRSRFATEIDQTLVTVESRGRSLALCVDDVLGVQQVVHRRIEGLPMETPIIAGGALMGDGSVALIIDIDRLCEDVDTRESAADMERRFLLPGESVFCREETLISTLLGSCVAVCLYDNARCWGGMNHYMLPEDNGGSLEPGKYGDVAIRSLVAVARSAGSRKSNLVASVYGGGPCHRPPGGRQQRQRQRHPRAQRGDRPGTAGPGGHPGDPPGPGRAASGRKIQMNSVSNEITCVPIQRLAENARTEERKERLTGRKARVLVVDDSATVRRLLRRCIDQSGDMEVCGEAEDAYEARERILELDPDLLTLDVIMPRMDGNTFLKKLMQYKPIPVVIVSTIAKDGSEMADKLMASGAVETIDKDALRIYQGLETAMAVVLPALRRALASGADGRPRPL
jgi:CheY-like chemotaxis protein